MKGQQLVPKPLQLIYTHLDRFEVSTLCRSPLIILPLIFCLYFPINICNDQFANQSFKKC